MAENTPKILLSNDDGIEAQGLRTLFGIVSEWADCRVVAPAEPKSGVGHALSFDRPIEFRPLDEQRIAVFGTPADCARIALSPGSPLIEEWAEARRNREIWLLSGINEGANLGMDLYPSGTAAAAREACLLGFHSIAVSQYIAQFRDVDWEVSARRARPVLKDLLDTPPKKRTFWNVNLPHPANDQAECKVLHCLPDPVPQPVRFVHHSSGFLIDESNYHDRARLAGHDVDICFGGDISISQVPLLPESNGSDED